MAQTTEDDLQDEFIGFTDEPAGEEEDELSARPGGSPKAAEEPSTSGRSELPWTRASYRIRSATIRLHNGGLLLSPSGLNSTLLQPKVHSTGLIGCMRSVQSWWSSADSWRPVAASWRREQRPWRE